MAGDATDLKTAFDHVVTCANAYHKYPNAINEAWLVRAKQVRAKLLAELLLGGQPEWYENL